MIRIILSVLLTGAVLCPSIPLAIAQSETDETDQATLEAAFEAELTTYAATHTDAELIDYVNARLNQLTDDALANPDGNATSSLSNFSSFGESTIFYFDGEVDLSGSGGTSEFDFCMNTRTEECRRAYNAEILTSGAVATAIFAGCLGLTVGSGLIACAAAALAAHALYIAAAQQRYEACKTRAYSDCRLAYPRK
jgi:hypothetical protein